MNWLRCQSLGITINLDRHVISSYDSYHGSASNVSLRIPFALSLSKGEAFRLVPFMGSTSLS